MRHSWKKVCRGQRCERCGMRRVHQEVQTSPLPGRKHHMVWLYSEDDGLTWAWVPKRDRVPECGG